MTTARDPNTIWIGALLSFFAGPLLMLNQKFVTLVTQGLNHLVQLQEPAMVEYLAIMVLGCLGAGLWLLSQNRRSQWGLTLVLTSGLFYTASALM